MKKNNYNEDSCTIKSNTKRVFLLEFDLFKDIKRTIKKHILKMLLIVAVFFVIMCAYLFLLNFNTSSTTVMFRYADIGKGLNPDGTKFSIYEVLSDDVLNEVVKRLGNDKISVKFLRNHLVVVDGMSNVTQDKIEQSILDGLENYTYIPSQYTISYSQVFGPLGAGKILSTLTDVYKEYFIKNHVSNNKVLSPDLSDLVNIDYINSVDVLKSSLESMHDYVNERQNENIKFVSKETKKSFNDLSNMINNIILYDLENYSAYITKTGISKDKTSLIRQLKYAIEKNEDVRKREEAEYDVMMNGIKIYDETVTKVVFVPTLDTSNEFYMARTNTGIDYLTEKASTATKNIHNIDYKIEGFNDILKNFKKGIEVDKNRPNEAVDQKKIELYKSTKNDDNKTTVDVADEMLKNIILRIDEVSRLSTKTDEDYVSTQEKSYPTFHVTLFGLGIQSNIKYIVEGLILSLVVAYLIIYFITIITKKIKRVKTDFLINTKTSQEKKEEKRKKKKFSLDDKFDENFKI